MKKITMIAAVALVVLSIAEAQASPDRQSRREARQSRRGVVVNGQSWQPVQESATAATPSAAAAASGSTANLTGSDDALDEVNEYRAKRGLAPFQKDPLLTQAARSCAKIRAANHIHGHLSSDFDQLPPGAHATAAGCGALAPSWGWGTCCMDDNYTYAGAAWYMGSDGRRYMHLFVR